jgi:hypothetical protein
MAAPTTESKRSSSPSPGSRFLEETLDSGGHPQRGGMSMRLSVRPSPPIRLRSDRGVATGERVYLPPATEPTGRPADEGIVKFRRPVARAGSARALAMLMRHPLSSAPVPRHHVEPRVVDGTLIVNDRASDEQFKVYTPRFLSQFRSGHHAGLWYLRPVADAGTTPRSRGFATARDAVEALRDASWSLSVPTARHRHAGCRVIWR